jgi:Mg2+ and Co2+ transporter CorA
MDEKERELRRRINENLTKVYSGVYRREADAKRKEKLTELEKATPHEIQMGHDVLERRQLDKRLKRLLLKRSLTPEETEYAEDLQMRVDQMDEDLRHYNRTELSRFVRVWNKSRKVRYRL